MANEAHPRQIYLRRPPRTTSLRLGSILHLKRDPAGLDELGTRVRAAKPLFLCIHAICNMCVYFFI